eukprot:TRINITY_DN3027_c0_g1_i2.p1 TRINITY_DN3027_c0_g1~~TRINITY_DN3027_c0_g1_i2.p1  ORF type:complete len:164 (-),score=18.71 TRINITY_DN3027_c0_g1_i2:617-1108(-)
MRTFFHTSILLLVLTLAYPAHASFTLLRGKRSKAAKSKFDPPPKVQKRTQCFGCEEKGFDCGDCEKDVPTIRLEFPTSTATGTCQCSVSGDICSCTGSCSVDEQDKVCEEIIGPCSCFHQDEGICECSGHCRAKDSMEDACMDEPGCTWAGNWCEAEVGLVFS